MRLSLKAAAAAATLLLGSTAMAQITFYEGEGFHGRSVRTDHEVRNMERIGFNDRAASAVVDHGRWEVCEHARFEGRCAVLRRGSYPSLRSVGLGWQISSVRPANPHRHYDFEPEAVVVPGPAPQPLAEYRRGPGERVYDVPVMWSHAVMGPPSQRCWVERQSVPVGNSGGNAGGAIAGALIGGILGHQVGGGSGRDAATAAGAIAGAAIGANSGGGGTVYGTQDVQRCRSTVSGPPAYWDVAYSFRGVEHHVQMSSPPGATITVNERGEPRM
ncbi:MAG TPA: beta/gamma crystallin family protein [Ramlibacter sp.]|uniref:beta/gamma crystallin family protein n=1 Tax=Ramlibacter sp. TaxID=1917967 RepID=UPI002C508077|nr:beta/gamma crystallin family protein [Ramlibacter sp.]HVZ43237.1 beta/gamma crystallin family protein [Ramlibacter sp.]